MHAKTKKAAVGEALARWHAGRSLDLVLLGGPGSGKSTQAESWAST